MTRLKYYLARLFILALVGIILAVGSHQWQHNSHMMNTMQTEIMARNLIRQLGISLQQNLQKNKLKQLQNISLQLTENSIVLAIYLYDPHGMLLVSAPPEHDSGDSFMESIEKKGKIKGYLKIVLDRSHIRQSLQHSIDKTMQLLLSILFSLVLCGFLLKNLSPVKD